MRGQGWKGYLQIVVLAMALFVVIVFIIAPTIETIINRYFTP